MSEISNVAILQFSLFMKYYILQKIILYFKRDLKFTEILKYFSQKCECLDVLNAKLSF